MNKDTQVVKPESDTLALIHQAMSDPNVNPDKLREMLVFVQELEADKALKAFNQAMHAAQTEMPVVIKDATNAGAGNSRYARLETVAKAVKPVYMKHGFSISFGEDACDREDYILIIATVRHIGNHIETYKRFGPIDDKGPKGSSVKTKLHGCQSTMSYMQRNLLCSIFGVTVADTDNDGNTNDSPTAITEKQADEIERYIGNLPEGQRAKILKFAKCESVEQIESSKFALIIQTLKDKLEKQEGES